MNKSHLTAAAAIIAAPIIGLQFAQNAGLRSDIKELNETIVEYETAAGPNGGLTAITPTNRSSEESGIPDAAGDDSATSLELESGVGGGASLGEILAQKDPMLRMSALLEYVGSLSDDEIPAALKELRNSTPEWDPDARVASQLMLTRWGKADPEGALTYLSGLDHRKAGGDAAVIISTLASSNPQRAVEWLEDPDNKLVNLPWMGQILAGSITKEWVRQDPQAALDWAMGVPENQRSGAYAGVLGTIAATDPVRASELAKNLPDSNAKREIIGQIARAWSENSPTEALEWASALEGDDRKRAMSEAIGSLALKQPEEAASYVLALEEDERSDGMIKSVAGNWARKEPAMAAQWVGELPEGKAKEGAMGDVMWNWTVADPQAASTWLLDQPQGDSRDAGIGALARATFDNDPASAVTWAANMTDDKRRFDSVNIGIRVWLDRDEQAAEEWLNTTESLTPDEIQAIRAQQKEK